MTGCECFMRHDGQSSAEFKSLIGVLTGDSFSPFLWNLYFADVGAAVPRSENDIVFGHRAVGNVEHTDDVALWSTSLEDLQEKVTAFYDWCKTNFMVMSVAKSQWMVFNGSAGRGDCLHVDGAKLELVNCYKFIGVLFASGPGSIFRRHYRKQANKAKAVTAVSTTLQQFVGVVAPVYALNVYRAVVEPHLMFGVDVVLDVVKSHYHMLQVAQNYHLCRALRVSIHTPSFALYLETGVLPIRYARVIAALKYCHSTLKSPNVAIPHDCMVDAHDAMSSAYSWMADLRAVLADLPIPVIFNDWNVTLLATPAWRDKAIAAVRKSADTFLRKAAQESKCHLLTARISLPASHKQNAVRLQSYLRIASPAIRLALTRLAFCDHQLAVEVLRRPTRSHPVPVPRSQRLCRFLCSVPEDEVHALLSCEGDETIVDLRESFYADVWRHYPTAKRSVMRLPFGSQELLPALFFDDEVHCRLGRFAADVFARFECFPTYEPPR